MSTHPIKLAKDLFADQAKYLRVWNTQPLICANHITVAQVLALTELQCYILSHNCIIHLILEKRLTVAQAKQLSTQQVLDINNGEEAVVLQRLNSSRFPLSLFWQPTLTERPSEQGNSEHSATNRAADLPASMGFSAR